MLGVSGSILISAFNENFQASWVYHSLPIHKPGALIIGSLKSLLVKFFIPIYLLAFAFCFYIWGWKISDDFFIGFLNNILCFLTYAAVVDHYLPFSRQPSTQQQTGRILLMILQMAVIGILIGLHYLLVARPIILICLAPFLAAGCWRLLMYIRNLPWNKIAV